MSALEAFKPTAKDLKEGSGILFQPHQVATVEIHEHRKGSTHDDVILAEAELDAAEQVDRVREERAREFLPHYTHYIALHCVASHYIT